MKSLLWLVLAGPVIALAGTMFFLPAAPASRQKYLWAGGVLIGLGIVVTVAGLFTAMMMPVNPMPHP